MVFIYAAILFIFFISIFLPWFFLKENYIELIQVEFFCSVIIGITSLYCLFKVDYDNFFYPVMIINVLTLFISVNSGIALMRYKKLKRYHYRYLSIE